MKAARAFFKKPGLIIALCVIITGVLGFFIKDLQIDNSIRQFLPQKDASYTRLLPPYITDEIGESWLGDQFGFENGSRLIKELADWYKQLAEMYHIDYLDAAQYVTASPADACHLDEENQRKLGKIIADYVKTALPD